MRSGRELLQDARDRFNRDLHTSEYDRIHSDQSHLRALIEQYRVRVAKVEISIAVDVANTVFQRE